MMQPSIDCDRRKRCGASQLSTMPHHSRSPEFQANQGSNCSCAVIELGQRMLLMPDFTYSATPHLALFNANRISCLGLDGFALDHPGTSIMW
jgi:hypothetical protein